jgi:flagellar basal body-associated protein FliL
VGGRRFSCDRKRNERGSSVSILWIILIIVLVLLLLGFFSRGRW